MSITRQRMLGRSLTLRRSMPEMTTLEKSILVISPNPASYKCSDNRELPQPGTNICNEEEGEGEEGDGCCWIRGRSESRSWGHSAYHSNESSSPRMVKKLSQFSLLVKSPSVLRRSSFEADGCCFWFFFFPIFALHVLLRVQFTRVFVFEVYSFFFFIFV